MKPVKNKTPEYRNSFIDSELRKKSESLWATAVQLEDYARERELRRAHYYMERDIARLHRLYSEGRWGNR